MFSTFSVRCTTVLACVVLIAAPLTVQAQNRAVPVMVGGEADLDTCGSVSRVAGLKREGDNFLAVRSGPGTHFAELDRLRNGRHVYVCGEDGPWQAIVYGTQDQSCGVTSPIARRQVYRGPCRSGWVHRSFLRDVAG